MHRALLVSPLRYFMAIVTQCISLLSVHVSLFVLVWHISRKAAAQCKYRFGQFYKIVEDIGRSIARINDLACVLGNVKRMLPWGFRVKISRNLFGLYAMMCRSLRLAVYKLPIFRDSIKRTLKLCRNFT